MALYDGYFQHQFSSHTVFIGHMLMMHECDSNYNHIVLVESILSVRVPSSFLRSVSAFPLARYYTYFISCEIFFYYISTCTSYF